jgi:recombinational DNA repair ATPase RecF
MKIEMIEFINFRSIKKAVIQPKKGINIFSGDNGSGKTTVLYALSLLLLDIIPGKLEDLINWDSTFFEIYSEFTHNGKQFKEKIFYDGSTKRELWIEDI